MIKYDDYIMKKVRQNLGLASDDKSNDEKIMKIPKREVLKRCLVWEGLIGYEYIIIDLIDDIFGTNLDDICNEEYRQ